MAEISFDSQSPVIVVDITLEGEGHIKAKL